MWLLLFLVIAASTDTGVQAIQPPPKCLSCIKYGSKCHNVTYLLDFNVAFRSKIVISKIGVWRSKNFLLFAFEPNITDPEYSKVAYVNLDNPSVTGTISNGKLSNYRTFDIDQHNNIVYLGGGDAIWTMDSNYKPKFYSSRGDSIKAIFYKNNVFFVKEGELRIVEKIDELFKPYERYRNVKNFVITKDNVLVFLNTSGLYASSSFNDDVSDVVYLSKNAFFRGLALDLDGLAYTWWVDGIYKIIIDTIFKKSRIIRMAEVADIGALTFDTRNKNQLMFTAGKSLFALDTNSTAC